MDNYNELLLLVVAHFIIAYHVSSLLSVWFIISSKILNTVYHEDEIERRMFANNNRILDFFAFAWYYLEHIFN